MLGPILLGLNNTATVYVPAAQVAPGLHAPADAKLGGAERLRGSQAQEDTKAYRVWHKTDSAGGPAGKYLVDDAGAAVWLVDPGINGAFKTRPDGTQVRKFDAPKATLMSYIIKGILDRKLPWALVLFGVMIAVVLELCGVSSLAFAVGVYLPVSSSAPFSSAGWCAGWWTAGCATGCASTTSTRPNSPPRATRAPACCWPAATSRAARSRASSSRSCRG